jgi:hypothetical protein
VPAKEKWTTEIVDGFLISKAIDPRFFWLLEIMDLWDACGEEEAEEMTKMRGGRFASTLYLTASWAVLNDKARERVRSHSGLNPEDAERSSDEDWAYDIFQYGVAIPIDGAYSKTEKQAYRLGRRLKIPGVESALGKIVNQMGQTGLEYIVDNLGPRYLEMEPDAIVHSTAH